MHQKPYKSWFSGNRTTEKMILDFYEDLAKKEADADDLFHSLKKEGDRAVNTHTGEVVELRDGKLQIVGVDFDFKRLHEMYRDNQRYKENTFTKIIERTAKGDAYARMGFDLGWVLRRTEEKIAAKPEERLNLLEDFLHEIKYHLEWFKGKAKSHREFVEGFPVVYNYATQNFVPRTEPEEDIEAIKQDVSDTSKGLADGN